MTLVTDVVHTKETLAAHYFEWTPPNQSLPLSSPHYSFRQHIPLCHTVVKPETPSFQSVRAVPELCILHMGILRECLVIFLGIPNQKTSQKKRGVSFLEITG